MEAVFPECCGLRRQHEGTMKTNLGRKMRYTSSEIEDQIGVMMTSML